MQTVIKLQGMERIRIKDRQVILQSCELVKAAQL